MNKKLTYSRCNRIASKHFCHCKGFIPKQFIIAFFLFFCAFFTTQNIFAEKITFSADSMTGIVGDKSDSTTLSGEAYVLTDTMEIFADKIGLSGKDFRYIEASGSVKGKNMESELEFTCGRLKYDRETKIANLMDNVDLTDVKNNVKAKAQSIEYNQNSDIAVMQIEIELTQKNNICTGAYAIYRKADQMLELTGNSQIKQGDDTFRAQQITLDLNSQEITLDGRVKGSIVDERKSEKNEKNVTENNVETKTLQETSGSGETQVQNEKSKNSSETPSENEIKNEAKAQTNENSESGEQNLEGKND